MKKRIGIWIRVSTEEQAKGDSPEHHEERAKMYAKLQDWNIIETYHLEAVSGKSVINHPEAQRMLKDIKSGHIDGLIFSKLARLARNTKELLEFADLFKQSNADLISLEEKIDTSTPAGRLFYTLIAAMSQWEREEISSRVSASVPIRAKLGKSLGGAAPYGYEWKNNELTLHPTEAPVRKLIHELFAEHKRKKKVAKIINDKGYRSRKGNLFTDSVLDNFLRDPITKGMRRVNYTNVKGEKGLVTVKPQEDWVFVNSPRLISDELWQKCNDILDGMTKNHGKVRSRGVYLFAGVVTCECGEKMYMRLKAPKYVCKKCKNKIEPDILEEVFHEQLKSFLFSDTEIQKKLDSEKQQIIDKQKLLTVLQSDAQKLKDKIDKVMELYFEGNFAKEAFDSHHSPLYTQQQQKLTEIAEVQSSIDSLSVHSLSSDQVLHDAKNLYTQWNTFTKEDKKNIIETVVKNITIGAEDIEIELAYLPLLSAIDTNQIQAKGGGHSRQVDTINLNRYAEQRNSHSFELVGIYKEPRRVLSIRNFQS